MLKLYKNTVQRYIEFVIKKDKIDTETMREEDLLFHTILDAILTFSYICFGIFATISV